MSYFDKTDGANNFDPETEFDKDCEEYLTKTTPFYTIRDNRLIKVIEVIDDETQK